jgi:hypothetical protein
MSAYFYLSLIPEALIASMLEPRDFGTYLAVGTKKRTRGQAMFFSLKDPGSLPFDLKEVQRRCVAHPDGEPKHSLYVSIYRVLERVPIGSIGSLYMVTPDGRVLEIQPGQVSPSTSRKYHLYQEICPVHTRVVSALAPEQFTSYITDPAHSIFVPRICFAELRLGELADDPEGGSAGDLPFHAMAHLRDCLVQLRDNPGKETKTVDRVHPQSFPYQTVEGGVYLGDSRGLRVYPFPSEKELQSTYYEWWRSASIMSDLVGTV